MLDTNILVDFILIYSKEDKKQTIPKSLISSKNLLLKFESAKFFNIMSEWIKWELRKVIMQIRLEQKFVLSGYSHREFGDARKEINLTQEEIELVNKAVFDIWKHSTRITKDISKNEYEKIEHYTKKGFSFMDCLHILQAKMNKCDYFVTRDKKIREIKDLSDAFDIKIIGIKEFLDKLKKEY